MGSNKGMFEECWTPIHNRDPGDEQVEGHRVEEKNIALEASEIVQERGESYGPPIENHSCTAHMWNAYLRRRFSGTAFRLDAEDVCVLNVLQKISRQAHTRKRDNLVDILGFVINIDMLD